MAFRFERGIIMWKENKKTVILTSIISLLPILVGMIFWNQLPDKMATHFGYGGEPNGWSSKWSAVFGLPVFVTVIHLICVLVTGNDPGYYKYPEKMKKIVLWICPVCSWICALGTYGYELNGKTLSIEWIMAFMGLVFVIIGNYLPKIKQNYYLGIKLPWTYTSEDNWNKTHRFGGKVWVVGGIFIMMNVFLKVKYLELVLMAAMILIPTIYSYLYSRKELQKGSES